MKRNVLIVIRAMRNTLLIIRGKLIYRDHWPLLFNAEPAYCLGNYCLVKVTLTIIPDPMVTRFIEHLFQLVKLNMVQVRSQVAHIILDSECD